MNIRYLVMFIRKTITNFITKKEGFIMGFYTDNILTVTGKKDELMKFHNSFKKDGPSKSISLEKLYPVPKELLGNRKGMDKWCNENWNIDYTDELECDKIIISEKSISYHFTTKWEPPFSWIDYVSEEFPSLVFELEYDDLVENSRGNEVCIRCTEYWEQ